jgi:hypothetical protein
MLQQVTTSYNKLQCKLITKNKEDIKMRKPSVTRTISTLNITVIGMDTVTCEPMTKTYPVYESEAPKDKAKLFNYVRKMYETDTFKISAITDKKAVTKTYSMPLSKYIEEAEEVIDKKDKVDKVDKADTAQ